MRRKQNRILMAGALAAALLAAGGCGQKSEEAGKHTAAGETAVNLGTQEENTAAREIGNNAAETRESAADSAQNGAAKAPEASSGGGSGKEAALEAGNAQALLQDGTSNPASSGSQERSETPLSFEDLQNLEFIFSSGAGAWSTSLIIRPDGSFSGSYRDSDMGDMKEEYPNGTVYQADFTGQFSEPRQTGEHTYRLEILSLDYDKAPGTEEIRGGVHYLYTAAAGLEDTDHLLLYTPGAPLETLPEEFRSWIGYYDLAAAEETELPFYALNNEAHQQGFSSYDAVSQMEQLVSSTESQAKQIEQELQTDAHLTQTDLNQKAYEVYALWDSALNQLWGVLKQVKSEDTMERLTAEERAWIQWKDSEVEAAGAEYEGGSMQPMQKNSKAADLTRDRVYELLKELQKKEGGAGTETKD